MPERMPPLVLSKELIASMTLVSDDERRTIHEWTDGQIAITVIATKEVGTRPIVLGNHRHDDKGEYFTVIKGEGVYLAQKTENGQLVGEQEVRAVHPNDVMIVPIGLAHTIICEPGLVLHCFSTRPFNGDEMKPHILVDPKDDDLIDTFLYTYLDR